MTCDDPRDPLDIGSDDDNVRRAVLVIKPGVERAVMEMYRVAESEWDAHPIAGCEVWREGGLVFAARVLI